MIARIYIVSLFLILVSFGCGGDKPTEPKGTPKPTVSYFDITPTDIVPPDSALVTWRTGSADSVKLFPAGTKLIPTDSGQIYVKPTVPTNFQLTAYNAGGTTSSASVMVTMTSLSAQITDFRITPDTVVMGDTSTISWSTTQADSIVLNNGYGKLLPANNGVIKTTLQNTGLYRAIAYSIYGNDTVTIDVRVKKPTDVRALNGDYYKGVMGSTQLSPSMRFIVTDAGSTLLDDVWLTLNLIEGDGVLTPFDSIATDANGYADLTYNFNGNLGHAIVSANFRTVDTAEIYLRANTIIPGIGGQGQYIRLDDTLGFVKSILGTPEGEVEDPINWYNYIEYINQFEVVIVIADSNNSHFADDDENVLELILTTGYTGKTKDSIGIGSTYDEIKAVYGDADSVFYSPPDPNNPPGIGVRYDSAGLLFYIDTVTGSPPDTNKSAYEIHLMDLEAFPSPAAARQKQTSKKLETPLNYRRYRR